jgi:hypothetical protein
MEIVVKAIPSRQSGLVRFYANCPDIPSFVVAVSSYVELQAEYRIYCKMIRDLGHTVYGCKSNLYLVFVESRPESEREPEYRFGFSGWRPVVKNEQPVFELNEDDKDFLKSVKVSVED